MLQIRRAHDDTVAVALDQMIDRLIDRYGNGVIVRATDLRDSGTASDRGMNLDFLDYREGERVSRPG